MYKNKELLLALVLGLLCLKTTNTSNSSPCKGRLLSEGDNACASQKPKEEAQDMNVTLNFFMNASTQNNNATGNT